MRLRLIVSTALVAFLLVVGGGHAAAGKGVCQEKGPATSEPATRVSMTRFCFEPGVVSVGVGHTVEFVNEDGMAHNISGPGWFEGELAPGRSVSRTFDAVGTYTFGCTLHPGMTGAVVVGEPEPIAATAPVGDDRGAPATLVLGIGLALLTGLGTGWLFGLITGRTPRARSAD